MYASSYHELDGFLELVLACYPMHVLVYHVARLGEGITGSSLQSRVRLTAVIGRWGLASLVIYLRVGEVLAESQWREPWRRLRVSVSVRGRGKDREAPISEGCGR